MQGLEGVEFALTQAEQSRKKQMLNCFVSQRRILDNFPLGSEWLRRAPRYDFSAPPHHPGTLYYETRPMGWTGDAWRRLACEAVKMAGHEALWNPPGRTPTASR